MFRYGNLIVLKNRIQRTFRTKKLSVKILPSPGSNKAIVVHEEDSLLSRSPLRHTDKVLRVPCTFYVPYYKYDERSMKINRSLTW